MTWFHLVLKWNSVIIKIKFAQQSFYLDEKDKEKSIKKKLNMACGECVIWIITNTTLDKTW